MKKASALLKHVPNFITSLNLVAGCIAIIMSFDGDLRMLAPYLLFLAMVFDFLDGFAARLLNAYSEKGKQLDSLADVVSFGVAPAMLLFQLMQMALIKQNQFYNLSNLQFSEWLFLCSAFLIPIFGAFRLAKFNLDHEQKHFFKGLPIPANAFFFSSLCLFFFHTDSIALQNLILNRYFLATLIIASSLLMVSNIPMISLKFKNLKVKDNVARFILILGALMLVAVSGFAGLTLVIPYYILISLTETLSNRKKIV
jgi:CDP-diacylglycerol---serine O-phosphatidyltransferase